MIDSRKLYLKAQVRISTQSYILEWNNMGMLQFILTPFLGKIKKKSASHEML